MERNGPGEMKTESRSPMSTSGVATPNSHARSNIAVVIMIPATVPASAPAKSAFVLLIERLSILQLDRNVGIKLCSLGVLSRRSPRQRLYDLSNAIRHNVAR